MNIETKKKSIEASFPAFVDLIKKLRSPGGCPWDIEQTFESLIPCIIEEAYELSDAMRNRDLELLREEVGDVLLHVVMLSNMASEEKAFDISDVIFDVHNKMIRRHPHVFGDQTAKTSNDVVKKWDAVKNLENKDKKKGVFDSIPNYFPALMKSLKIQKKVGRMGFDWPDEKGAIEKIKEEVSELEEVLSKNSNKEKLEDEFGDVLFSFVNIARKLKIDPEEALNHTNRKFIQRYEEMLTLVEADNQSFESLSLEIKEKYWVKAKQKIKKS